MTEVAVRPTELLDQLASTGVLRKTGLYLNDPNISYNRLEALGALFGEAHDGILFAMGDWLLLVEAMFPEQFSQAFEVLGIRPERASDLMRVSSKVPRSIRRESKWLKWSHYRPLAALTVVDEKTGEVHTDHAAQREWLDRIESQRISHHDLREQLRNGHSPPAPPTTCRCCGKPL